MSRRDPILVTGANSGIGLETVLSLARRGWRVFGTVRSAAKAATLREAARTAGVATRVEPVELDVSDHAAVTEAMPSLPAFYAVVNNAGYCETGAVEDVDFARAKAQLDINLITPAVVSAAVLPAMRDRGRGRIVMVSSAAGRAAILPLNGWYHASKFGLEALSDILRVEVADFGIRVSIVEPGFCKTDLTEKARALAAAADPASPYAQAYGRVEDAMTRIQRVAPSTARVARKVVSAIESRWPRRRYVVGLDARAAVATQPITPRPVTDLAMRWLAGLR